MSSHTRHMSRYTRNMSRHTRHISRYNRHMDEYIQTPSYTQKIYIGLIGYFFKINHSIDEDYYMKIQL